MKKADYPEWVMKYKSKGVYVNKVGSTYYLYRAHSVYVKETKTYRRVSDGYIGRVTEKDGFIPVRDKINGDIEVYEHGLVCFMSLLLKDVYKSLSRNRLRDSIMALAILKFLDCCDYSETSLFYLYKKSSPDKFSDDNVSSEADRVCRMLDHFVSSRISTDDWQYFRKALPSVHLVKANDKFYICRYSDELKEKLKLYGMEMK